MGEFTRGRVSPHAGELTRESLHAGHASAWGGSWVTSHSASFSVSFWVVAGKIGESDA